VLPVSVFAFLETLRMTITSGPLAQLVEQRTFNPWVDGSSPSGPTL
jgi:hypothetical protein